MYDGYQVYVNCNYSFINFGKMVRIGCKNWMHGLPGSFDLFRQTSIPSHYAGTGGGGSGHHKGGESRENELVMFLQLQLAEAINLQDRDLIAQLQETIRCLKQFEQHE